ncbi:stemmadenine O-acetyltransferase-like [Rhodamnia argentea]|uniref:Stemmadenine O-acetyltransferase-like n=1 Tax=Rhodamnia argentea TaxID=178133 RepID=A0A8B8NL41_9MYRT|nr:stemmadenine O-acetyltransferase-like [Rhodamnia argentea]
MEVEIISKELVKPSSPMPAHLRTYGLSLLDSLVPAAHIPMILFYDRPTAFSTDEALRCLKRSPSQAKVDCSLYDVLVRSDAKVIRKLLPDEPSQLESSSSDGNGIHVIMVQVNVFECGGIALGTYLSHKIIDSPTSEIRHLHDQALHLRCHCHCSNQVRSGAPSLVAHLTRIEAVSAFIWGCCIATTEACQNGARQPSMLSHMINLWSKNKSSAAALLEHVIGNLIWFMTARSEPESERNLQSLTSALRESLLMLNVEFFEGLAGEEGVSQVCEFLEEMSEAYGDEGADHFGFSSLFNMGVYKADFGWGKPVRFSPSGINLPVYQNVVFLIETRRGDGIEAWVTLGDEDMAVLQHDGELLSCASVEPEPSPSSVDDRRSSLSCPARLEYE